MDLVVFSLFNGLVYGLLLYMLSSGLTLIFSMMGVLNLAHASFFMLGAYFGYQISRWVGFWPALFLAPLAVGAVGALVERYGLRTVHRHGHVAELLFTFGLAFIIQELVVLGWGRNPVPYAVPAELDFQLFTLMGTAYPAFKIFAMGVAVLMFLALFLALTHSRVGLIVQASLTHPETVGALGHDVPRVFMAVFGAGAALAGLAGVIGGPILVTEPHMASTLGSIVFVVIVVGGLGSLTGALLASLLIGMVQTFAVALDASLADFFALFGLRPGPNAFLSELWRKPLSQVGPTIPYLLMVVMLLVRPRGFLGRREV